MTYVVALSKGGFWTGRFLRDEPEATLGISRAKAFVNAKEAYQCGGMHPLLEDAKVLDTSRRNFDLPDGNRAPENTLWLAVLDQAIQDLEIICRRPFGATADDLSEKGAEKLAEAEERFRCDVALRDAARLWLLDPTTTDRSVGSAKWICKVSGVRYDQVLERVQAAMDSTPAVQPYPIPSAWIKKLPRGRPRKKVKEAIGGQAT